MTGFTRITVVGSVQRADIVVPSDEDYGTLVPAILEVLDEPIEASRPLALIRITGEQLDLSVDSATQSVLDGEILRIVRQEDAPPPPEVSDVTDVVADALVARSGRWNERARYATAAAVIGVASGLLGTAALAVGPVSLALLALAAGIAVAVSVVAGLVRARWTAIALAAGALGLAVPLAAAITEAVADPDVALPSAVILTGAVAWVVIGACFGGGLRRGPALTGAVAGGAIALLAGGLLASPLPLSATAGIVAIAAVVLLGVLPWVAMTAAGLTGLDDQVVAGALPRRRAVTRSLDESYRSLDWLTVAFGSAAAAAATALVLMDDVWPFCLGVAVILVTALRTRAFPLALEGVVVWAAAALPTIAVAFSPFPPEPLGIVLLGCVVVTAAILAGWRPVAHQRARLRRFGNLLELVAMISLVPLLLGCLGLYSDLLYTFE